MSVSSRIFATSSTEQPRCGQGLSDDSSQTGNLAPLMNTYSPAADCALVIRVRLSLVLTSFILRSGNFIVVASTTSTVIGLTWGGVNYSWSSAQTLVPLILGLTGLVVFFLYEIYVAKEPLVSIFTSPRIIIYTKLLRRYHSRSSRT